jgi:hypothetical protein
LSALRLEPPAARAQPTGGAGARTPQAMTEEPSMIDRLHAAVPMATPEWTEHNDSDPGVTLVELHAFLGESLLYRTDGAHGQVNGLAVQTEGTANGKALQVSPGTAVSADGRAVDLSALVSRYIGETEKNLASRFGDAVPSNAVLRNDDADALFDDKP